MGTPLNKLVNKRAFIQQQESTEWPLSSQLIGIELELENLQSASIRRHNEDGGPYWTMHEDHSLRGGTEWVLSEPMMGMELSKAISYFFKTFKGIGKSSLRASTHIHINMLQDEDTIEVLRNMTALYYAVEDAMYSCISSSRKWAVYAAPLGNRVPEDVSILFSKDLGTGHWVNAISRNTREAGGGRYYGFNLKAMSRFGTIEFRHFPAVTTEEELRSWVRLVMEIKKAAVIIDALEQTTKDFLATEEAFDKLAELMPEWGPQLLRFVDRQDSIGKVQALYELIPLDKRYGQDLEMLDTNPIIMRMPKPATKEKATKTKKLQASGWEAVPPLRAAPPPAAWRLLNEAPLPSSGEREAQMRRIREATDAWRLQVTSTGIRGGTVPPPNRTNSTSISIDVENRLSGSTSWSNDFGAPVAVPHTFTLQETRIVPTDWEAMTPNPTAVILANRMAAQVVRVRSDFEGAKASARIIVRQTSTDDISSLYWAMDSDQRRDLRDTLVDFIGLGNWQRMDGDDKFRILFFVGLVRGMFPQYLTLTL